MIHGRMSPSSDKPATILVYELKFLSRRGTRIKDADILFEFQLTSKRQSTVGPTVFEVRPNGQSKIGETIENQASKLGLSFNFGPSIPGVDAGITTSWEQNISKDVKFHTTVTGDNPADEVWGDKNLYFDATNLKGKTSKEIADLVTMLANPGGFEDTLSYVSLPVLSYTKDPMSSSSQSSRNYDTNERRQHSVSG
ncbi:d5aae933-2cf5-439c-9dc9-38faceb21ae3 [Sclerotinia trifoliorum]|uniref:D5aae933-2cf5-439c-9dc9-38faceb21ae3 n=1 Tax=Sclerotinia trifoliorum TaxID=28548 RepID=A0A8H2ZPT3_9HELO|nr:d5aae933-2cf5-439c-9dc9-38faceb21ae3 [Sclerotinia trifoliorum]